jgi:hypothetical protein
MVEQLFVRVELLAVVHALVVCSAPLGSGIVSAGA